MIDHLLMIKILSWLVRNLIIILYPVYIYYTNQYVIQCVFGCLIDFSWVTHFGRNFSCILLY